MIKFIKKRCVEISFVVSAILYLPGLVSEKDWINLIMIIILYIIIGEQTVSIYYQDKIDEYQKEHIKLLEKFISEITK